MLQGRDLATGRAGATPFACTAKNGLNEGLGRPFLAAPLYPGKEIGVGRAPGCQGTPEGADGTFLSDYVAEGHGLARRQSGKDSVCHEVFGGIGPLAAVDDDEPLWLPAGKLQVAVAHLLVELQ